MRLFGGLDAETGAVVLLGGVDDFASLAGVLRDTTPTTLSLKPVVGRRVIEPLGQLVLELAPQAMSIAVAGNSATFRGARDSYDRIAYEIDQFVALNDLEEPGVHTHIDSEATSTEDALLASDSRELILAGLVPD